jgi:hypothetical protein
MFFAVWRRFHSSLALLLSAGDDGIPKARAEAPMRLHLPRSGRADELEQVNLCHAGILPVLIQHQLKPWTGLP